MKKRLFLLILAVAVPVIAAAVWYTSEKSFSVALEREKQRTQWTESVVYRSVQPVMTGLSYTDTADAARRYTEMYAPQGINLIFFWNSEPIADAALPGPQYKELLRGGRTAILDTLGERPRYAVAEPISTQLSMMLVHDMSDLYAMRDRTRILACAAVIAAIILIGVLSLITAGFFIRPLRRLKDAAGRLAEESGAEPELPVGRKDEIGALASAFARMRDAVRGREEALRAESESRQALLDALAHEMRTPLTSLLGNARLMQKDLQKDERSEVADSMVREVRRLSDMDLQLMKLTRFGHETPEFERVDVLEVLTETARRFRGHTNGVRLEVCGGASAIVGDRELLSIMADNLTANAVRYSPVGEAVTLTAFPDGFAVADNGPGMTEEQQRYACEPFWKADRSRSGDAAGAGLGLSLCKRIAEIHNGELLFDSEPRRGTTVRFTALLQPVDESVTSGVTE